LRTEDAKTVRRISAEKTGRGVCRRSAGDGAVGERFKVKKANFVNYFYKII
jgi:hypothetical protein